MTVGAGTLRVVIADDERVSRERLHRYLGDVTGVEVIASCRDGREALDAIHHHHPDVVFLDIEMPELDGIEVMRRVSPECVPYVVFVTAHGEHALDAFRERALDYVLKPYDPARLNDAVERARALVSYRFKYAVRPPDTNEAAGSFATASDGDPLAARLDAFLRTKESRGAGRLLLKVDGRHLVVNEEEIDVITAGDNHVTIRAGRTVLRTRYQLSALHALLSPYAFVRVHRSHVLNVERIREVHAMFRGEAVAILRDGTQVPVSARYRDALLARLGQRS